MGMLFGILRVGHATSPGWDHAVPQSLHFVFLGSAGDDAALGVQFGVEEAARTAMLVGAPTPTMSIDSATAVPDRVGGRSADGLGESVTAYIGGSNSSSCARGVAEAGAHAALFITLRCYPGTADAVSAEGKSFALSLGDTATFALTFHIVLVNHAELWLASREPFGAGQLNDRFRARFNAPMSSAAWAGWMAVKIVTESAMRTRSSEPRVLANYMLDSTTRFDGHKGTALRFSRLDHQLIQPVYRRDP